MDSIGRSLRPLLAPASSPAAISTARPATARYAVRHRFCLHFGFTQRDVMRVPTDRLGKRQLVFEYIQSVTPFGRTCQPGTTQTLTDLRRAPLSVTCQLVKRPSYCFGCFGRYRRTRSLRCVIDLDLKHREFGLEFARFRFGSFLCVEHRLHLTVDLYAETFGDRDIGAHDVPGYWLLGRHRHGLSHHGPPFLRSGRRRIMGAGSTRVDAFAKNPFQPAT